MLRGDDSDDRAQDYVQREVVAAGHGANGHTGGHEGQRYAAWQPDSRGNRGRRNGDGDMCTRKCDEIVTQAIEYQKVDASYSVGVDDGLVDQPRRPADQPWQRYVTGIPGRQHRPPETGDIQMCAADPHECEGHRDERITREISELDAMDDPARQTDRKAPNRIVGTFEPRFERASGP